MSGTDMSGTESSADSSASPLRRLRGWRRGGFRCAAVLLGLFPFVLLEIGLRLLDVGKPESYVDPFVGFSRVHPLFELDEDAGVYRTVASRELYFGTQQFSAGKAANEFRIFGLGGSTVRGRPYQTDTAFLKWLELELSGRDPSRTVQTINCGGLSYAS